MPQLRKVSPDEAAGWDEAAASDTPDTAEIARLRAALGAQHGITRIDRGGEHAWRARVYTGGAELHRQFSDTTHLGTAAALCAAVAWRDAMRARSGPRPPRPARAARIVRAEYTRMCGWLAYAPRGKRYFADSAHGGRDAARATAAAWLAAMVELEMTCDAQ